MPGDRLQGLLLVGGIALIGIGVVVGVVILVVTLRRRRAAAGAEEPRLSDTFLGTTGTAADERPFAVTPLTGASAPGGPGTADAERPSEARDPGASSFVASRDPQPAPRPAPITSPPVPLVPPASPTEPAAPIRSGWGEIIAAGFEPLEDAGYTTSSFAPPGQSLSETPTVAPRAETVPQPIVEPERSADLTSPPLANPWLGTGPQPPVAEPEAPAAPPTPRTETVPTIVVERVPLAAPAPPPSPVEREPDPLGPEEDPVEREPDPVESDEDRTILLARPGRAPWILVLDTGERIDMPAESVVLGRKLASVEHGVPGVAIPDATKTMSKVHARIDRAGDHWTLTDLGSTNGSSVIEAGGRERLLSSGGSEPIRGRFLLGEAGMILVRNPEARA